MDNPIHLSSLSPREAIADTLYRCLAGLDTNDRTLFDSAWVHDDSTSFEMPGRSITGMDALNRDLFDVVGPMDSQHMISNVRINVKDGADTAWMSAYSQAVHYRPGEGKDPSSKNFTGGTVYYLDIVNDSKDGLWKIKKFRVEVLWFDGDRSVVHP